MPHERNARKYIGSVWLLANPVKFGKFHILGG